MSDKDASALTPAALVTRDPVSGAPVALRNYRLKGGRSARD